MAFRARQDAPEPQESSVDATHDDPALKYVPPDQFEADSNSAQQASMPATPVKTTPIPPKATASAPPAEPTLPRPIQTADEVLGLLKDLLNQQHVPAGSKDQSEKSPSREEKKQVAPARPARVQKPKVVQEVEDDDEEEDEVEEPIVYSYDSSDRTLGHKLAISIDMAFLLWLMAWVWKYGAESTLTFLGAIISAVIRKPVDFKGWGAVAWLIPISFSIIEAAFFPRRKTLLWELLLFVLPEKKSRKRRPEDRTKHLVFLVVVALDLGTTAIGRLVEYLNLQNRPFAWSLLRPATQADWAWALAIAYFCAVIPERVFRWVIKEFVDMWFPPNHWTHRLWKPWTPAS